MRFIVGKSITGEMDRGLGVILVLFLHDEDVKGLWLPFHGEGPVDLGVAFHDVVAAAEAAATLPTGHSRTRKECSP